MKIEKNWINDVYTSLTETLANDQHKITSGITKKTFASGSKATAAGINTLINEIKGLKSNEFLGRYADCFTGNEALNATTSGTKILDDTKEQIDNYVTKILQVCGNKATSEVIFTSGCTKCGDNLREYPETGCTNIERETFHPETGCTNAERAQFHPFSTYTDCTDKENNFRRATCVGNFGGCADHKKRPCSGNVLFSGNSPTGNTACGVKRSFNANPNFTGDTHNGNNYREAFTTGHDHNGNNFRPAFTTGQSHDIDDFRKDVRIRADFNVKISSTAVVNTNFI